MTEVSTPQFVGKSKNYYDEPHTGCSVFWPKFEPSTFRTQKKLTATRIKLRKKGFLRILGIWLNVFITEKNRIIFLNITFGLYFPLLTPLKHDKRITLGSRLSNARFEVLLVLILNNIIVWEDVTLCTAVEIRTSAFGVNLCYYLRGRSLLTHWGRGHLNCLTARSRGF